MKPERHTLWHIWRWPLVFGLLSSLGLLAGLLGDGWLDLVSWLSLGLVAVVCCLAFK
jgi:hypothetical protein